jgi:hypothetical protein
MKIVNGKRVRKRKNKCVMVRRGSVGVPIYTTRNVVAGAEYLKHEVVWYDADGKRCKLRFSDLGKAKREASRVATKLANCDKETLKLSPADSIQLVESQGLLQPFNLSVGSAIREFVAARQKLPPGHSLIEAADYFTRRNPVAPTNKSIGDIVAEMLEARRKAGVSEIHLRILKGRLERFAEKFQCPLPSITVQDVSKYVSDLKAADGKAVKNRTRGNTLSDLRNFFNFARKQRYITRDLVEEINEIAAPKKEFVETGIFTPAQTKQIIGEVRVRVPPI